MINEASSSTTSNWWRWPILPFASFLGAALGASFFLLLQWGIAKVRGDFSEDGWYFVYILPMLSSAVFGYLLVFITLYIAPKGKVIAAAIMLIVLCMILLTGQIFMWSNPYILFNETLKAFIQSLITIIAAVCSIIFDKDRFQ